MSKWFKRSARINELIIEGKAGGEEQVQENNYLIGFRRRGRDLIEKVINIFRSKRRLFIL